MNVSATPPFKPPMPYDGVVTTPRSGRPQGKIPGPSDILTPLPPVTDGQPTDPTPTPPVPAGGSGGGTTPAPDDMFNVDGLLQDWGKKDSAYDLDGNGSVDGWDLALFLGGQRPKSDEPTYNVSGLMDHWGQSDSPYDLDGNGTVDGWDLAMFLGGSRPGDSADGTPAVNDPTNSAGSTMAEASAPADDAQASDNAQAATAIDTPRLSDEQRFLNRITKFVMQQAGITRNETVPLNQMSLTDDQTAALDPDGDGMVQGRELMRTIRSDFRKVMGGSDTFGARQLANDWIRRLGGSGSNEALASRPGAASDATHSQREAGLTRLTSFVNDKFEKAGFTQHPPRNLHAVLAKLNLSRGDQSYMLKQFAERYPDGLGINSVG